MGFHPAFLALEGMGLNPKDTVDRRHHRQRKRGCDEQLYHREPAISFHDEQSCG
jgi:hypothetical protein